MKFCNCMGQPADYVSPGCTIINFTSEGVLCASVDQPIGGVSIGWFENPTETDQTITF